MRMNIEKKHQSLLVKAVLLALSVGAIAFLTSSLALGITIVAMILFHESGHIFAAKQLGIGTRGIYMLPFLGGIALIESMGASRKDECYISLMGPIFGLIFSVGLVGLGLVTGIYSFANFGCFTALINLFNLLPINPLDGGRVFKSICFSIHRCVGLAAMLVGVGLSIFLAANYGIYVLYFVAFIGMQDFFRELNDNSYLANMSLWSILVYSISTFLIIAFLLITFSVGAVSAKKINAAYEREMQSKAIRTAACAVGDAAVYYSIYRLVESCDSEANNNNDEILVF